MPWRFVLTFVDVLVRPGVAFPGPARVSPGIAFAVCGLLASAVPFIGIVIYLSGDLPDFERPSAFAILGSLVVLAAAIGALISTQTVCFGAGLMMVGRRYGVARFAMRAACYASAIWWVGFFAGTAANLLLEMNDLGWIAILSVWALLTGRVFAHAARGLGLRTQSAILAALGPTLACTIPVALLAYERLAYLAD